MTLPRKGSIVLASPYRKGSYYHLEGKAFAAGAFGQVYRASDRQIMEVRLAVKYVPDRKGGEREADGLGAAQGHPHILPLYDAFPDPLLPGFWLVTERCIMDLYDALDRLTNPQDRQRLFLQASGAIAWCHSLGIAHRDIKPENILIVRNPRGRTPATPSPFSYSSGQASEDMEVEEWIVRVADFGLAVTDTTSVQDTGGSPEYMSPEAYELYQRTLPSHIHPSPPPSSSSAVSNTKPSSSSLSFSYNPIPSDTWSLGILATLLLSDKTIWRAPIQEDTRYAYFLPHPCAGLQGLIRVSNRLARALCCAIHPDPEERVSVKQFIARISQIPWSSDGPSSSLGSSP